MADEKKKKKRRSGGNDPQRGLVGSNALNYRPVTTGAMDPGGPNNVGACRDYENPMHGKALSLAEAMRRGASRSR